MFSLGGFVVNLYKLTMVLVFVVVCLVFGALLTVLALIPGYILFVMIVIRVSLNWRKNRIKK
jgi:hypothetical protein